MIELKLNQSIETNYPIETNIPYPCLMSNQDMDTKEQVLKSSYWR